MLVRYTFNEFRSAVYLPIVVGMKSERKQSLGKEKYVSQKNWVNLTIIATTVPRNKQDSESQTGAAARKQKPESQRTTYDPPPRPTHYPHLY